MKKILIFVVITAIFFSCSKSSDDDPGPTPTEKYKVTYSFTSMGLDTLQYIKYLNVDGVEVTVTDTNEYSHSFEQPSNNIHGQIIIKGEVGTMMTAYASYSMKVTDKSDNIIYIKESETSSGFSFTWTAEYKNIEN